MATDDRITIELCDADGHVRKLRDIETDIIYFALNLYGGSATEVARRLCISRSTLYRKLNDDAARRASDAKRGSVTHLLRRAVSLTGNGREQQDGY
jgi:DNA-binding NtrC family response regulator